MNVRKGPFICVVKIQMRKNSFRRLLQPARSLWYHNPGKHGKLLATLYSAGGEGPLSYRSPFSMAFPDVNRTWILHSLFVGPVFSSVIFFLPGMLGQRRYFSLREVLKIQKAVLDFVLNDTQYNFDKNHIFFIGPA